MRASRGRPAHPPPHVRACDADRDRVIGELRERFADGSLAQESFVLRVDAALRARRHGELAEILADLPGPRVSRARAALGRLAQARRAAQRRVAAYLQPAPPPALMLPSGTKDCFTIGRDAACDLVLSDMTVSRTHADLRREADGWLLGARVDAGALGPAAAAGPGPAPGPWAAISPRPPGRARERAAITAAFGGAPPPVAEDKRLGECHYGDWTGQPLKRLAREPLWRVVQAHPGAARFPGADGESIMDMQHRAVSAIRDWNERLGAGAVYLICSHGDVIKSVIADSLGMHLDMLQRIQVDPCSLTAIRYTPLRPFVLRMNGTGCGVGSLRKPEPRRARARAGPRTA